MTVFHKVKSNPEFTTLSLILVRQSSGEYNCAMKDYFTYKVISKVYFSLNCNNCSINISFDKDF